MRCLGTASQLALSLVRVCRSLRSGWREVPLLRPSFSHNARTYPTLLNLVLMSAWTKPQLADGASVKASEKHQSTILRLRYCVDMSWQSDYPIHSLGLKES